MITNVNKTASDLNRLVEEKLEWLFFPFCSSFFLSIMLVWHIGQQRNPSNPAYLKPGFQWCSSSNWAPLVSSLLSCAKLFSGALCFVCLQVSSALQFWLCCYWPSASHDRSTSIFSVDKCTNILLLDLPQELVVWYFLRPGDSQNLPEVSCVEGC